MQMIPDFVGMQDQNLYGSEFNFDRIYERGNMSSVVIPQSRAVEILDQNVYGSNSNIDRIYNGGNMRLVFMP